MVIKYRGAIYYGSIHFQYCISLRQFNFPLSSLCAQSAATTYLVILHDSHQAPDIMSSA